MDPNTLVQDSNYSKSVQSEPVLCKYFVVGLFKIHSSFIWYTKLKFKLISVTLWSILNLDKQRVISWSTNIGYKHLKCLESRWNKKLSHQRKRPLQITRKLQNNQIFDMSALLSGLWPTKLMCQLLYKCTVKTGFLWAYCSLFVWIFNVSALLSKPNQKLCIIVIIKDPHCFVKASTTS